MKHCLNSSFILLLIFYISANSLKAQHTVTGKVLDDKGKPIYYANVVLQVDGKNDVKYDITNKKGKFTINDVKKGNYKLYVQYFSKDIYTDTIKVAGDLELGNITAKSGLALLDEVVKTSKKPIIEQKVDRLVFNASNSIAASDGSALDALKKTPMVNVKQDGISLMGKGSVAVLINDRIVNLSGEDLLSYLESVSSVNRIEVITTPPAKYEAKGNSGLINIILKKGLLNHWSNSTRTSYKQATYPGIILGNTFNYNKDKLSINAGINAEKNKRYSTKNYEIFLPSAKNEGASYTKVLNNSYLGRLGIDYRLSKSANIGGIFKGWQSLPDSEDNTVLDIKDDNKALTSQIFSKGTTDTKIQNISVNLHYSQKLDTMGRSFSIDLDYFKYKKVSARFLERNRKDAKNVLKDLSNTNNQITNYSAKLDFEHPTSWANINYGGKLSYTNTDNNTELHNIASGKHILDPKNTDHFNYQENVHSLYFDVAKNIGKKWQLKLGLRYEYTSTLGNSMNEGKTKRSYGKLFPTAYIQYVLNDKNYFNITYNRRIQRPSFGQVNPFMYYTKSNTYKKGNPELQPSFSNSIEIHHGFAYRIFTGLYAQFSNNEFRQIITLAPDNNSQIHYIDNYYNGYALGLSEAYMSNPFPWWESSNQMFILYVKESVFKEKYQKIMEEPKGAWTSALSTSNSFILNPKKTLSGEINFRYQFPLQVTFMKFDAKYSLDIALKAYFLERKLTVSLAIDDILKTNNANLTLYTNNIKQMYNSYNDSRYVKLTLRYSFGNKKIKVKQRKFGNEEENKRTSER